MHLAQCEDFAFGSPVVGIEKEMEEAVAEVKKAVTVGRTDVLNTVLENCHKCEFG